MKADNDKIERIFQSGLFELPIVVGESNYLDRLKEIYKEYLAIITDTVIPEEREYIEFMCNEIVNCIEKYHFGYPHRAYETFDNMMKKNNIWEMIIYNKTGSINKFKINDPLKLYRVRHVQFPEISEHKELFHTPFSLRSNIGTCRYSIAGYPSLYLGTSLKLCLDEVNIGRNKPYTYASKFQIERNTNYNGNISISVLEFGVKPSDFFKVIPQRDNDFLTFTRLELLNELNLNDSNVRDAYIKWYPLYAACSFIRKKKTEPFASEYIIPQLLMQWLRIQSVEKNKEQEKNIVGLRYFPCSSKAASERGMNYIFPISDITDVKYSDYCSLLANSIKLTKPLLIDRNKTKDFQIKLVNDMICSKIL